MATTFRNKTRVTWLADLARQMGKKPQFLRDKLIGLGYRAPYTNKKKLLEALRENGVELPEADAPVPKSTNARKLQAQLIHRLADLFSDSPSKEWREQKVRNTLRQSGYRPPWNDETKALEAFKAAGIPTDDYITSTVPQHTNGANVEDKLTLLKKIQARDLRVLQALTMAEGLVRREFIDNKRTTIGDVENALFMALNELRKPI